MTDNIIHKAYEIINNDIGNTLDDFSLGAPLNDEHKKLLVNIISKASSFMGNIFENRYNIILNQKFSSGKWIRNDPDFPDLEFVEDNKKQNIGIEIKSWFPLSTEITGRFKESQTYLKDKNIDLVLIAWIPEHVLYGKPLMLGCVKVSAMELAKSRDTHYHKPPFYLLQEPENTLGRTRNLQQRNVNGFRLQEDKSINLKNAKKYMKKIKLDNKYNIKNTSLYNQMISKFPYRLDTNFSKIDRINNPIIEKFKKEILDKTFKDKKISEWRKYFLKELGLKSSQS